MVIGSWARLESYSLGLVVHRVRYKAIRAKTWPSGLILAGLPLIGGVNLYGLSRRINKSYGDKCVFLRQNSQWCTSFTMRDGDGHWNYGWGWSHAWEEYKIASYLVIHDSYHWDVTLESLTSLWMELSVINKVTLLVFLSTPWNHRKIQYGRLE